MKHTPEVLEKVREIALSKGSFTDAAAATGLTRNAVAGIAFRNNIRFSTKVVPGRGRPTLTESYIAAVRACAEEGLSMRLTAKRLRISIGSVQYVGRRYKVSFGKKNNV